MARHWIFAANGPCVPSAHGGGRAAGETGRRPHEHGQDHQGDAAARRGSTIRPQQVDSPVDNAFFFGITSTSASAARARAVLAVGRIIFIGILTDTRRAALSGTMGFLRKGCRKRVFGPFCGLLKCPFWPMMSSLCFSLASAPPLYQPEGKGHRSRAPPAASGPSVCPSSDFRASNQVCCPRTRPSATSRTRSAAAAARLHADIPAPAAPTTITQALATLRPPFLLF